MIEWSTNQLFKLEKLNYLSGSYPIELVNMYWVKLSGFELTRMTLRWLKAIPSKHSFHDQHFSWLTRIWVD